jgi:hypothetical protein
MGIIFVGYRYGVGGFTNISESSFPFANIADFQSASRSALPVDIETDRDPKRDFDIARPYFDAFQFYFQHIDLYEVEYGNKW